MIFENKILYFFIKQKSIKQKKIFLKDLWNKKEENKNKKIALKILKIIKIIFYTFSAIMIFWSFLQSFIEPITNYSKEPGSGLEFGFFGKNQITKNLKYDAFSLEINPLKYHAFYSPSYKYGPFLSWFVYPFAYFFNSLIYKFKTMNEYLDNSGINIIFSMIILLCIFRTITFFTTLRSTFYNDKQYKHKNNLDKINSKYNIFSLTDQKMKNNKSKEISIYNKKHKLKPFASFENFFINTPIFLIIFKVITTSRALKFTTLFGIWELSETPFKMIFYSFFNSGWAYLLLCLLIIPINFLSQKLPNYLMKKRHPNINEEKKTANQDLNNKKIQRIITIVFSLFTVFWSTGLSIYYFFNSLFTITQSFIIHLIISKINKKNKTFENKIQKLIF